MWPTWRMALRDRWLGAWEANTAAAMGKALAMPSSQGMQVNSAKAPTMVELVLWHEMASGKAPAGEPSDRAPAAFETDAMRRWASMTIASL